MASIFWGSFTCGRVLGIPLSLRFAPTEILAADLAGALCVMVALVSLGTRAPDEQALQVLIGEKRILDTAIDWLQLQGLESA